MRKFYLKQLKNPLLFMLSVAATIIVFPNISINAAREALEAFVRVVLPTLFPFIVCTNIILNLGGAQLFRSIFRPFMRLFSLPGYLGISYSTSIAAGYPSGLNSLSMQVEGTNANGLLAATILCSNVGPMFVVGAMGTLIGSRSLAWLILISHYVGGIIVAFIASRFYKATTIKRKEDNRVKHNFPDSLEKSIQNAIGVMLKVCGCIVIMRVFSAISMASPAGVMLQKLTFIDAELLVRGVLEMADGCLYIATNKNIILACVSICAIVSCGGISVILQSLSYLRKLKVNIKTYTIFKALHACVSGLICFAFMHIKPFSVYTSTSNNSSNVILPEHGNFTIILVVSILVLYLLYQCPRIWVRFCRTISKLR
jgi:sporulation integral membrane protein YlbJ